MACQTKVTKLERHPTVGTGKKISLILLDVGRVGMPNNEAGELYNHVIFLLKAAHLFSKNIDQTH